MPARCSGDKYSIDCQGPRKHSSATQRRGFFIQISFEAADHMPCLKMNRLIRCLINGGRQETEMIQALLRSEQEEHVGAYSEWCMRVIYVDTSKQFKGVNGGANVQEEEEEW